MNRRPAALSCLLLLGLYVLPCPAQPATVRVRLLELNAPQTIAVSGQGGGLSLFAADYDAPLTRLEPGQAVTLSLRNGEVYTALPDGGIYALSLRAEPEAGAQLAIDVLDGQALKTPRIYQGSLAVTPDPEQPGRLRLINHVDLESYVANVLPREYPFDDLEGAKAMAVVIRTYALRSAGKFGADYDHVDHVASQVYKGTHGISSVAREATRQTAGEVLTYGGELIEAVYFASSGGHTADNETVWSAEPLPYLRGKPDPYDRSPHARWQSKIPRARLLDVLSRDRGHPVEGFVLGAQGRDGRVRTVELLLPGGRKQAMSANAFRLLLNRHFGTESLKSTLFSARRAGDTYLFDGRGFGHGVGLCQWGTHEMARQGHPYQEILAFYYTGVALQTVDDTAPAPTPLVPVRTVAEDAEPPAETPQPSTPRQRVGW